MRMSIHLAMLLLLPLPVFAQSAFSGSLNDFAEYDQAQRDARGAVRDAVDSAGRGAIDKGVGWTTWGLGTVASASELNEAYESLDDGDTAYDPDSLDDGPTVPSSCAESEECNACYTDAVEKINFNRFYLQRAWSITHSYIDYAQKAEKFGDSASGIHAVSGLSWQLQGKPQIEQALTGLRRTYRSKYQSYIENLENALRGLGQCEAEHFGERDWYSRYGFIYLDFMKAKYESPEP